MRLARDTRIITDLRRHLDKIPGVDYAFHCGGMTQKNAEGYAGDVDILLVLNEVNAEIKLAIIDFIKAHIISQESCSFTPDYDFPIEMTTTEKIRETVLGRGLTVDVSGKLVLKAKGYSFEESLKPETEAEYCYWLYMLISNDHLLARGNYERFLADTKDALMTTFLHAADRLGYDSVVELEKVRRDIFTTVDAHLLEYVLSPNQTILLVSELERRNIGRLNLDGTLNLNDKLKTEIQSLKDFVTKTEFSPPTRIIEFEDIWTSTGKFPEWYHSN